MGGGDAIFPMFIVIAWFMLLFSERQFDRFFIYIDNKNK
jgi:hypothetical protein